MTTLNNLAQKTEQIKNNAYSGLLRLDKYRYYYSNLREHLNKYQTLDQKPWL